MSRVITLRCRTGSCRELSRRLLTLVRSPAVGKKTFYQKHIGAEAPAAIKRFEHRRPDGAGDLSLHRGSARPDRRWCRWASSRSIPGARRVEKLETPDRVTMDLDPDEGLPWQRVTEAAIDVRDALAGIGLQELCQDDRRQGPACGGPADTQARTGTRSRRSQNGSPTASSRSARSDFTANMAKRARQGRIYIDYLRNGRGATAVGAYIPRARPGAPVSTPLSWEEVEKGVRPDEFTVETVPQRLAALASDPWAEIGKIRQSISAAVRRQVGI